MAGELMLYTTEDGDLVVRLAKRDEFLKLGDHPLLDSAGKVTADRAKHHVDAEYARWHIRAINAPSAVEQHFMEAAAKVKKLASDKKRGQN